MWLPGLPKKSQYACQMLDGLLSSNRIVECIIIIQLTDGGLICDPLRSPQESDIVLWN